MSRTPLDPTTQIRIGFGLAGFQKAAADAFVASLTDPNSPNFQHWIDTSTFGKSFGAPNSDIQALISYLTSQGFTSIRVASSRSFITATGTLEVAAKAFGTSFANYVRPQNGVSRGELPVFFGPKTAVEVPADLASKISGAFGFTNFSIAHPDLKFASAKKGKQGPGGFTPAQVAAAYDSNAFEGTYTGKGMNIAIYSPTNRYSGDPAAFAQAYGIPQDFTIIDKQVDGGPLSGTNGYSEASVDIEMIIGQAPAATVYMIEPPSNQAGMLDGFDEVGTLGNIKVMTSSWGSYESDLIAAGETAFATSFENVCESLAASGVTIFKGSGDNAAYSSQGTGDVSVEMEPACPYVTGVGGTSLYVNSNGTYNDETLWEYTGTPEAAKGGGGGISQIFKMPSWQTGFGVQKTGISDGYREVPDVSSNADPKTGFAFVVNGASKVIGGSSTGGPLWAANALLIEQYYGVVEGKAVPLGNLDPALYTLGNWFENTGEDNPGEVYLFHDITVGTNGAYDTTPGYDMCNGWGSANFDKALHDLGYMYKVPNIGPDYTPFTQPTWTSPIMIHSSATTPTEPPGGFVHGTKYYFALSAKNLGNTDSPMCLFALEINGTIMTKENFPAMIAYSNYYYLDPYSYTFPTAGTYTISMVLNYGNGIRETNTTNDTFTRTITVN